MPCLVQDMPNMKTSEHSIKLSLQGGRITLFRHDLNLSVLDNLTVMRGTTGSTLSQLKFKKNDPNVWTPLAAR